MGGIGGAPAKLPLRLEKGFHDQHAARRHAFDDVRHPGTIQVVEDQHCVIGTEGGPRSLEIDAVELKGEPPGGRQLPPPRQFLGIAGRTEEGLRELDTAIRLSPRDPQLWTFHAGKQVVLWNAGRYEEAREASERALEIDPQAAAATAYSNIAATSALLGDLPRARAALAETLRAWPNMSITTLRTLFASIPEESVETFFDALRVAGWKPGEEDASTAAPTTS